jgi:hypothetical protein
MQARYWGIAVVSCLALMLLMLVRIPQIPSTPQRGPAADPAPESTATLASAAPVAAKPSGATPAPGGDAGAPDAPPVVEEPWMKAQQPEEADALPGLDLVPTARSYYYRRDPALHVKKNATSAPRVACILAGFMRNYELMLQRCRDHKTTKYCSKVALSKNYGRQRHNILDGTDCDVHIATWNIRGVGRYNTDVYDQSVGAAVRPSALRRAYGPRLASLHIQQYAAYEKVWRRMYNVSKDFKQLKSLAKVLTARLPEQTGVWPGVNDTRKYLRINDFSQAYKHWVALFVTNAYAKAAGDEYDVYLRLRPDLRASRRLDQFAWVNRDEGTLRFNVSGIFATIKNKFYDRETFVSKEHFVGPSTLHVNSWDVSDFGFMGPPAMINRLGRLWPDIRDAPVNTDAPSLSAVLARDGVAEYNLMLWRIVRDAGWTVDAGDRYLSVSRGHRR